MTEHRKISRVLQLISRLRQPFGYEKEQLAEIFEVNVRTIERYIVLLRDLGFQVVQDNKRLKIELLDKHSFRQEDLIVFTLEEAAVIKEALLGYKMEGPLKHSLLDKLYSLTDLDQLAETMTNLQQARTISTINKAIKLKRQVILQNYDSVAND
jgi:predicted DNA-binding transcriptional regulator YafY